MPLTKDHGFDTAVYDREKLLVALVEVKGKPIGKDWTALLLCELNRSPIPAADYLLAVDPVGIYLFRLAGNELGDLLVHLDTPTILSHYEPNFIGKRIFDFYLLTLVEAWLSDLAYHWKSPNPPGSKELKTVGFLDRVEGGSTQSQLPGE